MVHAQSADPACDAAALQLKRPTGLVGSCDLQLAALESSKPSLNKLLQHARGQIVFLTKVRLATGKPMPRGGRACIQWTYTGIAMSGDSLETCIGFDWDDANTGNNWERHHVAPGEAEEVFFLEPLIVRSDERHSKDEKRYYALGQSGSGRRLFVSFTIRRNLVRVISVRDMNRNETEIYGRL